MDDADKLMAQLLTSEEVKAVYDGFGPDVAYLIDRVQDIYCDAGRKVSIMRLERLTLFAALRQAIPDEYLFDPALGSAFYKHLKWLYKWAYLDSAPGQLTQ